MMELLLTVFYALVFLWIIKRLSFFRLPDLPSGWVPAAFVLKIIAGVILYIIYSYHYSDRSTADIFRYYDDSKVMYHALFSHPADYLKMLTGFGNDTPWFDQYYQQMNNWYRVYESNLYNDSHTIIRFNAFVMLFSFGCYNVHTVFMCFVSFTGLVALYHFFRRSIQHQPRLLFAVVFLIPSVLFWGSGVLKEGLLLFGMGTLLYHYRKLLDKDRIALRLLFLLVSVMVLLYTKFYIFMILLPLIFAYTWCNYKPKRSLLKYLIVLSGFFIAGINIHHIFPDLNLVMILVQKQHDFISLAIDTGSGSMVSMSPLEPDVWSLLRHIPTGFLTVLLRPFITEVSNLLMTLSALENLLILLSLLWVCIHSRKPSDNNIFIFCLLFFACTYTLTGITTPVMGAIVRYKVPALPFLGLIMLMLADPVKHSKTVFAFMRKRK